MTKKTQPKPQASALGDIVVFGLDESGKAKGARFPGRQAEQAAHAARSLKLDMFEADTDERKELAKKLPSGRIYAKGRAFVPFIKRELYDKLHVASGGLMRDDNDNRALADALADAGAVPKDTEMSVRAEAQTVVLGLPRYWDSIGPGHLVLVHDGPGEGWWESVVVARSDQMLSLRYRDYPKQKQFERHISTVALINPGPQ